jgi:hypothetical protein
VLTARPYTTTWPGYTGFGSEDLNRASRSSNRKQSAEWGPLLRALESGLAKLPAERGISYRSQDGQREYQVGQRVTFSGAVSTSRNPRLGAPVHLEIHFKRGVDVSRFSQFPAEREVVLWSPSFRVAKKQRTPEGWSYQLHEE